MYIIIIDVNKREKSKYLIIEIKLRLRYEVCFFNYR